MTLELVLPLLGLLELRHFFGKRAMFFCLHFHVIWMSLGRFEVLCQLLWRSCSCFRLPSLVSYCCASCCWLFLAVFLLCHLWSDRPQRISTPCFPVTKRIFCFLCFPLVLSAHPNLPLCFSEPLETRAALLNALVFFSRSQLFQMCDRKRLFDTCMCAKVQNCSSKLLDSGTPINWDLAFQFPEGADVPSVWRGAWKKVYLFAYALPNVMIPGTKSQNTKEMAFWGVSVNKYKILCLNRILIAFVTRCLCGIFYMFAPNPERRNRRKTSLEGNQTLCQVWLASAYLRGYLTQP